MSKFPVADKFQLALILFDAVTCPLTDKSFWSVTSPCKFEVPSMLKLPDASNLLNEPVPEPLISPTTSNYTPGVVLFPKPTHNLWPYPIFTLPSSWSNSNIWLPPTTDLNLSVPSDSI